jgi:alpha-galactosidase
MQRRHFIRLSATAGAAVLFNRLTSIAASIQSVINLPEEVWAKSGDEWHKLEHSGSAYAYKDIRVRLRADETALSVYVSSPSAELNAVRLKWQHGLPANAKVLGDHWERSYGDLGWKQPDSNTKQPWYFLLHDGKDTACFGVKTGCNAICWWNLTDKTIELTMDTSSGGVGVLLGNRELHAADIVTTTSTAQEAPFITDHRFCKIMCPHPRLPKQPVYGINDWYFAYGNNSAKLIKEITAMMTGLATNEHNRPFSVIDAGWATYSPLLPGDGGFMDDFSEPNEKFGDMAVMAGDIKKLGMRPGLWMRPLCAKHNDRKSLLLPSIPGRGDPKEPILDPTIPENLERIRHNISLYRQWGFELVKHDYSTYDITGKWGAQMKDTITTSGWHFNDRTKTTAEVINTLYHTIREAAGNMYLIGCNTMSHLSAGVFELNRIGDDTSGKEWARTRKMGVNTLGFRIPQHNAFYAADADCAGVTNDIPWAKSKQWMQLLAESGTPLFVSPDPNATGQEQKEFIKKCFTQAATVQPVGEPLDWMTNPQPAKWKLNGRIVDFDWS